jgi:hypothetical protein
MDIQVIDDLYNRAVQNGYQKRKEEFINLLHNNPEVFYDMYKYVTDNGYAKSDKDFSALIGMPDVDNFDAKRAQFQAQLDEEKKKTLESTTPTPTPTPTLQPTTTTAQAAPSAILPTQEESIIDRGKKKKKSGTTASPSGVSSSASPAPQPEPFRMQPPEFEFRAAGESVSQRTYRPTVPRGVTPTTPPPQQAPAPVSQGGFTIRKTQEQQKKEKQQAQQFVKEQIDAARKESERLSPIYTSINQDINKVVTQDLVGFEEEYVVPQLNYQFGSLGFKFEESGATGDFMKVTAPNGDSIEISLDNYNDSKNISERDKLRKFLTFNTKNMKDLEKAYSSYKSEPQRFVNEEEFKKTIDDFNKENKQFESIVSLMTNEKNALEAEYDRLSAVDPNQRDAEWALQWGQMTDRQKKFEESLTELKQKENSLKQRASLLDSRVAKYTSMKSEQGTWYDAAWNELLDGAASISAAAASFTLDTLTEVLPWDALMSKDDFMKEVISKAKTLGLQDVPEFSIGVLKQNEFEDWYNSLDGFLRSTIENSIEDDIKKDVKYGFKDESGQRKDGIIDAIRTGNKTLYGSVSTTPEWSQTAKEGFWGGALLGLVRSIPSMIGGGGTGGFIQRTAQMFAQGYDAINEEMTKNPEFENISESEKALVAVPIGIAAGALESIGFSNAINNKGVINRVVLSALGKSGTRTTAKTFSDLVKNEVESQLAKGSLIVLGGALAEAETGATQQLAEFAIKDIYNAAKGKEMFNTPDSFKEYVKEVALAGAQEAIGGFILGAPAAVSAAMSGTGFKGMDDNMFLAFEQAAKDDNMQSAFVAKLKTQVMNGETTMADAKKIFMDYRSAVGLLRQLPDNLSTEQKKESMNLLKEKRDLEESIKGKDEALVKKQKDRIAEINSQLNTISENAVQEQATGEVPVQPTARVGEEVEGGKPETKPEVVTTEGVKEEALTPQEQERKVALIEALKTPNQEKGTVTIGEEIIPVEAAQQELTTLEEKTKPSVVEGKKVEITEEPTSIKDRMLNELGVDVQVNEDGTFEEPVTLEETPDSKERIDNAIQQLTDAGYIPTSEAAPVLDQAKQEQVKQQVLNDFNVVVDFNEDGTFQPPVLQEGVTEEGAETKIKDAIQLLTDSGFTPSAEASVTQKTEPVLTLQEALDTDVKEVTSLEKVYNLLDNIDKKLSKELDPKNMNDITRVMPLAVLKGIVKAVKGLVKAGMTLQQAIKKVAADVNVTEDDVIKTMDIIDKMEMGIAEGLTEADLPGYDRMISEAEGIVRKSKQRGASEKEIASNVKNYITGSAVYERASDVQREALVRSVNKKFGIREKSAPSVGRLFGTIKDVKKITMKEMDLLKKQLKDTARGARNAVAAFKKASQSVAKSVDQLASEGKITPKQAAAVIKRFSRVNMFDDVSIDNFLNYMSKTFENAAYADRINNIRGNLKGAKSNIGSKIGVSANLMPILNEMLSVDPTIVPDSVFDMYAKLVEMLGARQAVLNLDEISEVTTAANSVMDAINEQQSLIPELANRFDAFGDKVVDSNGNLKYNETIEAMQDKGLISNNEAKLMKKFRKDISPVERNGGMTEQELSDEKDALVSSIENASIKTDGLPSRIERDSVRDFVRILRSFDLRKLNNTELKNLLRVIDNINNGYLPHYAQLIKERMEALNNQEVLDNSVKKAKPAPISLFYERIKSLITNRDAITELAKKSLGYIDQLFGDYKTKDIFNTLFKKIAQAKAAFDTDYNTIQRRLERVEQKIASSFSQNPDKTLMSKFKIMTYLIQQEYLSNPGSKQVNPVSEYLKKTIEHIRTNQSKYGDREANMLQKILDEYVNVEIGENEDGTPIFDTNMDKMRASFNNAELNAIKEIRDINDGLTEKALYTAAVIRGDRINPLNNYIHLNTEGVDSPTDNFSSASTEYNNSRGPSTKAKSLIGRTGNVVPLDFDVMASVSKGSRNLLIDYHMTEPLRVGRKTISETRKSAIDNKSFTDKQWKIFNAIENAFNEANDNVLSNTFVDDTFSNSVVNEISRQGYRAVLASVPRFLAELYSNITYALFDPINYSMGFKYLGLMNSADGVSFMKNVKSKVISRAYGKDTLSGKMIDSNILSASSGIKGGTASRNAVTNKLQQIYNLSLKKYKNAIELIADTLISTPDKATIRPIWFGTFSNEFKKITGTEPDVDAIAENNEEYMTRFKEAIDAATEKADSASVFSSSTNNPYMSTLKGQVTPNQNTLSRAFNNFNNFMTGFMINEYHTARTAINAAIGNGIISKSEGIRLVSAVTIRMVVYPVVYSILQEEMLKLFSDEEEEKKEDKETIEQALTKSLISAATSMFFGRDFGNATRQLVNYGIENVNEEYLDFLRNGEYDQYTDNIQNTMLPVGDKSKLNIEKMIQSSLGSAGPSVATAFLILKSLYEPEKKKEGAKKRQEQTNNVRIPLEIAGNLGLVPLYKDVKKIVVNDINKSLREELDKQKTSKEFKKKIDDVLKSYGFETREDMKRYAPDLYQMYFGEGSEIYEIEEPERRIKRLKEKLERRIKDDMYDYVPKEKGKKGGFGAGGFGEKEGGFGSGGFGEGKSGFGSKGFGQ